MTLEQTATALDFFRTTDDLAIAQSEAIDKFGMKRHEARFLATVIAAERCKDMNLL